MIWINIIDLSLSLCSLLTCPDDDSFAIIPVSGLPLHHLSSGEEDVLSLVVVVELDILIWYRHLTSGNINTGCHCEARERIDHQTFVTGMDSPVSMDSLTTQDPSTRTTSHSTV